MNIFLKIKIRKYIIAIIFCIILVGISSWLSTTYYNSQFTVLYSLDEKQNDRAIVDLIDRANAYVYFAIYFFTEDDIADALIRAKHRGLVVWGIMDRDASMNSNSAALDRLRKAGIVVETQQHPDGIMHIKALVTDKAYAMGSYNWTDAATTANDELLEIGTNAFLHDAYFSIIKRLLLTNSITYHSTHLS